MSQGRRNTCLTKSPLPVPPCVLQKLKAQFPVFLSDFPIELRQYPKGAEMPWHLDEQMYASPQWELIYTLDNTSDSRCARGSWCFGGGVCWWWCGVWFVYVCGGLSGGGWVGFVVLGGLCWWWFWWRGGGLAAVSGVAVVSCVCVGGGGVQRFVCVGQLVQPLGQEAVCSSSVVLHVHWPARQVIYQTTKLLGIVAHACLGLSGTATEDIISYVPDMSVGTHHIIYSVPCLLQD
jgi:hypothetical protein